MSIEPYELEQARLHFHSTIVKVPALEGGIAQVGELNNYNAEDPMEAYWDVNYARADQEGWKGHSRPSYSEFEFEPFYPQAGYYNLRNGAVHYTRSGKKQWQQSYSTSHNHSILRPLQTPLAPKTWARLHVSEVATVMCLFYPKWTPLDEALESLSESYNYRRRKPYSYALNRKLALLNMFPNRPPVLMYQQIPVGYMDGKVAVLAPTLSEFIQDISNYLEVRVA